MENKAVWSKAALNALPFSLLPLIVDITNVFNHNSILSLILTIVKIAGVVTILFLFMKQYSEEYDKISYGEAFKYGLVICLFSSVICTAVSAFVYLVIAPGTMNQIMEAANTVLEQYNADVDTDEIMRMLPMAIIASTLLKCLFWALALPAILASFTKKDNPF